MTTLSSPTPTPDPRQVAALAEARWLECLHCGRHTRHLKGRSTYGAGGDLLVQWWSCTACAEGETIS